MFRSPGQTTAEPCRASLVVLDFDGTLTDAEAHAPAFFAASRQELARRLGCDEPRLRPDWERARGVIEASPASAAWVVGGYDVCPAAADPYMIANGVAKRLLAERDPTVDDETLVARVLEVHHAAYARVAPPFRPGAGRLLEKLCAAGLGVCVVTNSHTAIVTRLLDSLQARSRDRVVVRGNANKFLVGGAATADRRFDSLPEAVTWPEVGRPVHLRRGRYFDVLCAAWKEAGASPESTLVVGDILELDLAMPATLGAHVHLVTRASTPSHERRLAKMMARGDADDRLQAVLDRLRR